ncbi:hypothetical protein AAHE18_13G187500 [Arachis hypogaea]
MSNFITLCRPHTLFFSSFITCRYLFQTRASLRNPNCDSHFPSFSLYSSWLIDSWELDRDADEEQIKSAYPRLAKFYHPDVYDGRGTLEEGETAEARFIKIQAAYELLIDNEKRRQYDMDNRASETWMEWLMKKQKAFDQRGDMAVAAWAEQQQQELNLRVRQLSRSKTDPDEARKILAREKAAAAKNFSNTLKRHTLVLKKRDLMRRKAEQDQDKHISQLLAAEGLELDSDE